MSVRQEMTEMDRFLAGLLTEKVALPYFADYIKEYC